MINVLDFGDDLQTAIDTAAQENQPLYFPAGEWHMDEPLHIPDRGLRMIGESLVNLSQSVIYYHGESGSLLRGAAGELPYGNWWGGVQVQGIAFHQKGPSSDPLVYLQGMIFSSWERCRFFTRGYASPGLMLDYNCSLNQFLHCGFEGDDWGLIVQGFEHTTPTINRFSNCVFLSDSGGNGVLLHGTNTNYFESCCWENLQTAVRLEPHTDPLINCRYNTFIAPRLENCATPFDWADTSDRNFVISRYVSACGPDIGNYRYAVELGNWNQVPRLDVNGYISNADKLRIWSSAEGRGLGLYQDMELTNRLLGIFNYQGKPHLRSKYHMSIESENQNGTLITDMPIRLAERTDAAAPSNTLYFSTDQNGPAFKDGNGIVCLLCSGN